MKIKERYKSLKWKISSLSLEHLQSDTSQICSRASDLPKWALVKNLLFILHEAFYVWDLIYVSLEKWAFMRCLFYKVKTSRAKMERAAQLCWGIMCKITYDYWDFVEKINEKVFSSSCFSFRLPFFVQGWHETVLPLCHFCALNFFFHLIRNLKNYFLIIYHFLSYAIRVFLARGRGCLLWLKLVLREHKKLISRIHVKLHGERWCKLMNYFYIALHNGFQTKFTHFSFVCVIHSRWIFQCRTEN